ncbi:MAG: glycosyltransferase family 2 protein [Flavobacteriales bacterium]
MSNDSPLVSVIMPLYNAAGYVAEAIESVLRQTYTHWELIVVDDGSIDGSAAIVRSFSDARIRMEQHSPNRGVSRTLNRALELAQGKYVARHDADDVSLPDRFAKQVAFLEEHAACGIIGTYATTMAPEGRALGTIEHHATDNASIQYAMLFDAAFVSSTVIFRRDLLATAGTFDETPERPVWDDYDMWSRLVRHCEAANLPEHLLRYRVLSTGLTGTTGQARSMVIEQRRRNIRFHMPTTDAHIIELLAHSGLQHSSATRQELLAVRTLLYALIDRLADTPSARERMLKDARARLMGFHVIEHTSLLTRAMDRIYKKVLLATVSERTAR